LVNVVRHGWYISFTTPLQHVEVGVSVTGGGHARQNLDDAGLLKVTDSLDGSGLGNPHISGQGPQ
jgi:hypothetical protein